MADLDISIYESLSVTESLDFGGDIGYRQISVSDSAAIAESVIQGDMPLSVYQAVSVTDVSTVQFYLYFYTDPRSDYSPKIPTYKIEADFGFAFTDEDGGYVPDRSIEACFGSELDEDEPVYEITAGMVTDSYFFSLISNTPDYEIHTVGGASLISYTPTYSLDSQFVQELYASLDKTSPNWGIEATIHADLSFTLDKDIPVWTGSLSMTNTEEAGMTLDEDIPVRLLEASMYEQGSFTLDKISPDWEIETESYNPAFNLDTVMPAWVIDAIQDAVVTESDRFSDYILRYVRP